MLAEDRFYTYILVDPRNGLPFYVGKGQRNRASHHIREARNTGKNSPKLQKIRKIESLGLRVEIRKVKEYMSDEQAKELECFLIAELLDSGVGLVNLTAGGEGSVGYSHSAEAIEKIRASQVGKVVSDETKQMLSLYMQGNNPMHRGDVQEKTRGENHWAYGKTPYNKGIPMSEEQRKRLSDATSGEKHHFFGKPCSEERRKAIAAATKGIKKSNTENMKKPKRKEQCPHCGIWASGGNLVRWHYDKCKTRGVEDAC